MTAWRRIWRHRPGLAVLLLGLLLPVIGAADDYVCDWWTIDSGGAMWSTGGTFELSGTIGQADAGGPLTGGTYELTGGFWASVPQGGPQLCAGDLNCDGIVDYDDIDPFVAALSCVGGDPNCWDPNCPWLNGDCDGDGGVTYADIDPFVGRIGATCP